MNPSSPETPDFGAHPPRFRDSRHPGWSYSCSLVPYHSIDDPSKLRRILEATLLIEADLDLPALLRHVIDEAQSMTGARYAALGVLNEERTALAEFITAGLTADEEGRIGARPTGRGVLGLLISDPKPLRLANLGTHARSFGFPLNHPPMTSFLGVSIRVRGEVYGNLYLTDKV
jgi:GAF domain-containing protein